MYLVVGGDIGYLFPRTEVSPLYRQKRKAVRINVRFKSFKLLCTLVDWQYIYTCTCTCKTIVARMLSIVGEQEQNDATTVVLPTSLTTPSLTTPTCIQWVLKTVTTKEA